MCIVKNPMCAPASTAVSPGASTLSDERDAVLLVPAADDVQADHVIGEIDEEPGAAVELLDDDRPIVGVRVVAILLLKLGRGHQMVAQFGGIARSDQLRADHVLAFRFAIEEQSVRPHDVLACETARMLCVHVRLCARRDVGVPECALFRTTRESYHRSRRYNCATMPSIRVMHFGLGPVGTAVVKQVAARRGLTSVGAIDIDPSKGRPRSRRRRPALSKRLGVKVSGDAAKALKSAKPDVVILCTSSSIKKVLPQIEAILGAKRPIVSTTEELSYPGYTHVRYARKIDALAKKARVAVLGTGVNPGFVMDALPIMLTAVCERVERVTVQRIQDARSRRLPFQQKIGAGLTTEQFQRQVDEGPCGTSGSPSRSR